MIRVGIALVWAIDLAVGGLFLAARLGQFGPLPVVTATDFISFYAAGDLANQGWSHWVYNIDAHGSIERTIFGNPDLVYYYFFYPPVFIPFCQVLALLPYESAVWVFLMGSAGFMIAGLRAISGSWGRAAGLFSLPAWVGTVLLGQNGFLTGGILAWGLALTGRRPWLSGLILAGLAYKPHLALLVAPALAAGRYWRALAGFGLGIGGLAGLATLLYGPAIWPAWLAYAGLTRQVFQDGTVPAEGLVTIYGGLMLVGAPAMLALAAQGGVALAALCAVVWLWARAEALAVRVAGLIAGSLLVSPVLLYYDLMPLAVAIAWLIAGRGWAGLDRLDRGLVMAVWLISGLCLFLAAAWHLPLGPLAPLAVLVMAVQRASAAPSRRIASAAGEYRPSAP